MISDLRTGGLILSKFAFYLFPGEWRREIVSDLRE